MAANQTLQYLETLIAFPTVSRDSNLALIEYIRHELDAIDIGSTLVPSEETRSDWLLGQADQALYAAKYSGRNQVVSADKVLAAFAGARDLRDDKAAQTEEPAPAARKRGAKKSA